MNKEMKESDIRKYAELMRELDLTGIEITEGETAIRLERTPAAMPKQIVVNDVASPAAGTESDKTESNLFSVKSTIVGVFYAAPTENGDPFVSIGDRVEKGQVLCIVEAMKLMNEICAEESGVIAEICVKNGQVVEYGTELFRLKR